MLTLQEALQLPILAEAKLVAGAGGVQRAIRWVHTMNVWHEKSRQCKYSLREIRY